MRGARRGATALAWACVATGAGILASPAAHVAHRRSDTLQVMAQSLVHWAGLLAVPPALVAARTRDRRLGLAAGSLGVGGLAAAAWIAGRAEPAAGAPVAAVAHFNLLYLNERLALDLAAIAATGADVLTFSEVTPRHLATLQHSALARHYPYRIERPGPYAAGTALWSRFPVSEVAGPVVEHHTVAADVDLGSAGPLRVIVIHTRGPMHHYGEWADDLAELAGTAAPDEPAVMIGDFNAGWGHPELRALTGAGWRDAHRARGRGLTSSWPTDRAWSPPFVRLDHAVVNAALDVTAVTDVELPGSDHRGLVVSVARRRRAS
jgi:endonuclease/exonuclease/phosphatase (EEP) superfamily protein YafD